MAECDYYDCTDQATHIITFEPENCIGPIFRNKLCKEHAILISKGFKGK